MTINLVENAGANNGCARDVIPEPLRRRRKHTIRMLRDTADTVDAIYQSYAGRGIKANAVGVIGRVTAVIGGIAAFATDGSAAPAMLTALSYTSGGSSIVGVVLSIKNGYDRGKEFEIVHQRLRDILREDEREIRDMLEGILHRRSVRDGSVLEPAQVAREVHAIASGLDGIGNSSWIKEMIKRIPSVTYIISHVVTAAWEGYNIYQNYCATQEKSQHGKELRSLAYKLERCLETGSISF